MQHNIKKTPNEACEICGNSSINSHYSFVEEMEYIILLNSPHIVNHNQNKKIVTFSDGQNINYDVILNGNAVKLLTTPIQHIFCSEDCENNLMSKGSVFTKRMAENTPIIHQNKSFSIGGVIIGVESINYNKCTCAQCGRIFPNICREFVVEEILNTKVVATIYNADLNIPPGFSYGHSDIKEDGEKGNLYLYEFAKVAFSERPKVQLCSDRCAHNFSSENNCVLFYKNNVITGSINRFLTAMTPYMFKANKHLGNHYKYRPQKVCPLQ